MDSGDEPQLSSGRGPFARWRNAAIAVNVDEAAQAAGTVQVFFAFCILTNSAYTAFYLATDPSTLGHVLGVNTTATALYVLAIILARTGRQLSASLLGLSTAIAEILLCSGFLGWSVGFHLFLLSAGQLVFMAFTDRQSVFRWIYLLFSGGVFAYCQFGFEFERTPTSISTHARTVLFSLNAVGTGVILFGMATVAYLRGREAQAEARASTARAEYLANTDSLTGLMNRRPVMLEFDRLDGPESGVFSVGIADLDRFKVLNDTFGHACGDRVLSVVGRTFRNHVRLTDIVGRWGGEEFIFVLPDTPLEDAITLMERLRQEVAELSVSCGGHDHHVTASFGVASGGGGISTAHVLKRADDAMYDAKDAGRNAVRARVPNTSDPDSATPAAPARPTRSRSRKA